MAQVVNAEEAFREANAFLEHVLTATPGMIARTAGPDLTVTYVSPNVKQILGYESTSLIGPADRWLALVHPDDREPMLSSIAADVLARRERASTEARFRHADGTYRWLYNEAVFEYADDGTLVSSLGFALDITERKHADEELRRSERRLAEAQRVAQIGSWEWDIATDSVAWSDELHRLYNTRPDEFEGTYEAFLSRVHPDDRERVRGAVERAYREGSPFSFDHRILAPDGAERILHGRGEVDLGEDGAPIRMHGTAQDVTELRRADEALRNTVKELTQAHAERRHLLTRIVHAQEEERARVGRALHDELGQVLTSIALFSKSLERQVKGASADRLAAFRSLLEHALGNTRALMRSLRPLELDELGLVPAVTRLAQEIWTRHELRIDVHASGLIPRLPSEIETTVYRIVQEALTNVVRHAGADVASVVLLLRDEKLTVTIEDDGAGFTIGGPQGEGTGLLGMRERADSAGASLLIDSAPGRGTTVRLEIPSGAWSG